MHLSNSPIYQNQPNNNTTNNNNNNIKQLNDRSRTPESHENRAIQEFSQEYIPYGQSPFTEVYGFQSNVLGTTHNQQENMISSYSEPYEMNQLIIEKNLIEKVLKNVRILYSLNDQVKDLGHHSNLLFKAYFKLNYFIQNGVFLSEENLNNIIRKKEEEYPRSQAYTKLIILQECSNTLAIGISTNKIGLCKIPTKDPFYRIDLPEITTVAFHPFIKLYIAVATKNSGISIYAQEKSKDDSENTNNILNQGLSQMKSSDLKPIMHLSSISTNMEFSPDGKILALVNKYSCKLTLWYLEKNRVIEHYIYGSTLNKAKWSPDGAYLAISSKESKKLIIFETRQWSHIIKKCDYPITKFEWEANSNSIYLFFRGKFRIRILKDMQFVKASTIYQQRKLEFEIQDAFDVDVKIPENHKLAKLIFCMEPKSRKVFFVTLKGPYEYSFYENLDDHTGRVNESNYLAREEIRAKGELKMLRFCARFRQTDKKSVVLKVYDNGRIDEIALSSQEPGRYNRGYN